MATDEMIVDVIAGSVSNLPVPAKATLLKALNRLTGGLIDIPAAVLEGWSQSIRDKTAAKSAVSQALATSAAKDLSADELTMAAVRQVYVPEVIRKTRNRIEVARQAAEQIGAEPEPPVLEDPDEDWINTFARFAEDASSERMQRLFAKILAGEMRQKGSFSSSALRAVFEMDQSDAGTLEAIWNKACGDFIRQDTSLRGPDWVKITRLRDIGLLSPIDSGIWQPEFNPVIDGISPWNIGPDGRGVTLMVGMKSAANKYFNVINFTRTGLELAQLLTPPDYAKNLRELAATLVDGNVRWVVLAFETTQEVLYAESGAAVPDFRVAKV